MSLRDQLAALSNELNERLNARGFDPKRLQDWAATIGINRDSRNRVTGNVEAPHPGDVIDAPVPGTEAHAKAYARGLEAITKGEVALCVLAGGMATRMGGVVKALVDAIPGKSFLDLRLREIDHFARQFGKPVPLWLMTSYATDADLRQALGTRLDGERIATFAQIGRA